MRVRMLKTRHGTDDGWHVRLFRKGQVYTLPGQLAVRFMAAGIAEMLAPEHFKPTIKGEWTMANASRLLRRELEPTTEPLSLAEAKLYLRVDGSDEDSLITDIIAAVREAAEDYLRRSLITQNWSVTYDDYAPGCTPLPNGPVQAVLDVKTINRDGLETVVSDMTYALNAAMTQLTFDTVPLAHQVKVSYVAGYGDAADVPESIRQGMLMHLAALYDNRLQGMTLPAASISLYKPFREMRLA